MYPKCEGNIPPFNTEEIHKYLKQVDGWEVIELLFNKKISVIKSMDLHLNNRNFQVYF